MFPSEHFAVAFVPVLAYVLLRDRRLPTLRFVGLVFLGSQFPDLIDKPLAHQFGLIPSGRVFMHSLPFALPVLCAVGYYGWRTDRPRLGGAFVFGYLSHLVTDNYRPLVDPTPALTDDLLWPLTPPVPRPPIPFWAGTDGINIRLWTVFSAVLLAVSLYVLAQDVRRNVGR